MGNGAVNYFDWRWAQVGRVDLFLTNFGPKSYVWVSEFSLKFMAINISRKEQLRLELQCFQIDILT